MKKFLALVLATMMLLSATSAMALTIGFSQVGRLAYRQHRQPSGHGREGRLGHGL